MLSGFYGCCSTASARPFFGTNGKFNLITILNFSIGLIQGLSTGFFLYITFVEMICNEIRDGKDLMLKVWSLSNFRTSKFVLIFMNCANETPGQVERTLKAITSSRNTMFDNFL